MLVVVIVIIMRMIIMMLVVVTDDGGSSGTALDGVSDGKTGLMITRLVVVVWARWW